MNKKNEIPEIKMTDNGRTFYNLLVIISPQSWHAIRFYWEWSL